MSEHTMRGIAKFVSSLENIKMTKITWFGGEPLMAMPQMEKLYRKLKRRMKGIPIQSNIITSGFHLNEPNIRALQRMKVSQMQITLDGMKESHNKIKFTAGCNDAFSRKPIHYDPLLHTDPGYDPCLRIGILPAQPGCLPGCLILDDKEGTLL